MKQECCACRYWKLDTNNLGQCRRFPTYLDRSASEWCGEFTGIGRGFAPNPEKFSDQELLEIIQARADADKSIPWREGCVELAAKFNCSKRTVEERVKKLMAMQKIVIAAGGNWEELLNVHFSVADWPGWVRHCEHMKKSPDAVKWRQMEINGILPLGGTKKLRQDIRWTYAKHLQPAFVALDALSEDRAAKYSALALYCFDHYKMNRAAFNRLLLQSVASGQILKNEKLRYYLAPLAAQVAESAGEFS